MSNQTTVTYSLTKLYWNTGSAFNEIPGVTAISGLGLTRKWVDTTNMDSVGVTEGRPANLGTIAPLSATIQFLPQNGGIHNSLLSRLYTGSFIDTWQVTFSNGTNWQFSGSVTDLAAKADNPADGILTADLKVTPTSTFVVI